MKMTPVVSSNVAEIGHEGTTMRIMFKGGALYDYSPVSAEEFKDFKESESQGRHLHQWGIKGTKVVEEEDE